MLDEVGCSVALTGEIQCVDKVTGTPCPVQVSDDGSMKCDTGTVLPTSGSNQVLPPTVKISTVNFKGLFTMKFSESMNLNLLANKTYNITDHLRYKYFLSEIHMGLKVRSGGVVDDTMLGLDEWFA